MADDCFTVMSSSHSHHNALFSSLSEPRHRSLKASQSGSGGHSCPFASTTDTPAAAVSTTNTTHFSTMPRLRHHRTSPKRKKCLYIDADVESEGSGLDSLDTAEDVSALQWKVDDLASQLTLINHAIFRELLELDLASLKWYNPRMRNHPESQRVNAITTRFNYDGQWTISEILKQEVQPLFAMVEIEQVVEWKIDRLID